MQVRAAVFQIMGFYYILYNISNFSFGPNFHFKGYSGEAQNSVFENF